MAGLKNYILALAVLPALTSCGTPTNFRAITLLLGAANYGVFSQEEVNLKDKNYAAADFMAAKMNGWVDFDQIILALPLEESDHAGMSSPLGANISQGVGTRLADLGYQVQLHEVATANDNAGLYLKPKEGESVDFILKGSYRYGNKHMDIFLRLTDIKSSKVVSSFDYSLPLSKEIRDLSETKPRIFRVTE